MAMDSDKIEFRGVPAICLTSFDHWKPRRGAETSLARANHSKLRVTPAMAAGVSDRLWEIGDIVALVEAAEEKPAKRGPYKKAEA
jgi:hypothetical protein